LAQPRREQRVNGRLIQFRVLPGQLRAHQADSSFMQVERYAKALGFGLKMFHLNSIAH
jgi:hypothetical protein